MSRVSLAVRAAFDAVVKLVGSTAFRHRAAVALVPLAVECINVVQAAFTDNEPNAAVVVAVSTAAIVAINWLRGLVEPS